MFWRFWFCAGRRSQGGNGLLLVVNSTADASDAAAGDGVSADASGKCTLRAAIEESNATASSSAIIFDLPKPSVIDLTLGELLILKSTSIAGPNPRQLTIRRSTAPGTANFRVLHVAPGRIGLIVRGMTIGNGSSDGPGGAIYVESGAFLNFFDSAATGNHAANGGGIASAGRLNVLRSLINGNYANEGGGVALLEGAIESSITASTLTDNNAVVSGGIDNRGNLALINDTISGNKASTASSISNVATATVGVLNTIMDGTARRFGTSEDFSNRRAATSSPIRKQQRVYKWRQPGSGERHEFHRSATRTAGGQHPSTTRQSKNWQAVSRSALDQTCCVPQPHSEGVLSISTQFRNWMQLRCTTH